MSESTERARFEAFHGTRKSKGAAYRDGLFALREDGTYADASVQRHWWTWQNALASLEVQRLKVQVRQADERGDEAMRLFHAAADERDALRAFAQGVMRSWPHGDVDGGDLQALAQQHGLLRPETRTERCGEVCQCAEYATADELAAGLECLQHTPLLTGKASP